MITQVHILSQNPFFLFFSPNPLICAHTATPASFLTFKQLPNRRSPLSLSLSRRHAMVSNTELSNGIIVDAVQDFDLDHFAQVANMVADAAGEGDPMHLTGVASTTAKPEKLAATDLETAL
jgi:hypothetical protein